ncbi:MAG: phosphate acyltransferase [Candidatus Omnitrophota bacterium]
MRTKRYFSVIAVLACFFLNVIVSDITAGLSTPNNTTRYNGLSAPSGFNDIAGIQREDTGKIEFSLQSHLKLLFKTTRDRTPGSFREFRDILRQQSRTDKGIYQPAGLQFFFNEAFETGDGVDVRCRISDTDGIRTYRAVFELTPDSEAGFPVKTIYPEKKLTEQTMILRTVTLPKNPHRAGETVFAAVNAITRAMETKSVGEGRPIPEEINTVIELLARGYVNIAAALRKNSGREPAIAALSYNTFNPDKPGIRTNANLFIVDEAIKRARVLRPGIIFYGAGSVQADTALVKTIAVKKAGGKDHVKGEPDVLVFPSFHALDIAADMLETLKDLPRAAGEEKQPDEAALLTEENVLTGEAAMDTIWQAARKPRRAGNNLPIIFLPEAGNENIKKAGEMAHRQGLARIAFSSSVGMPPEELSQWFSEHPNEPAYINGNPRPLMKAGHIDGIVAGIDSPTDRVIAMAALLKATGTLSKNAGVYDYFLMRFPAGHEIPGGGLTLFVNTASLPMPTAAEIAEMVPMAASDFKGLTGREGRVALLIGNDRSPDKMEEALALITHDSPGLNVRVCSFSEARNDNCNIFVFPDLFTGNICYKMAERVLGAKAFGPLIMARKEGKRISISDLSRGAGWYDILNVITILSAEISGRMAQSAANEETGAPAEPLPAELLAVTQNASVIEEIGVSVAPPVENYTLLVANDLFSDGDYEHDAFEYGNRFHIERIRTDKPDHIVDNIMSGIRAKKLDPKNMIVQLGPVFLEEEHREKLDRLLAAGIRFIVMETRGLKNAENRREHRRRIYSLMLLARKIDKNTPKDSNLYLLLNFLMRSFLKESPDRAALIDAYIQALSKDSSALATTTLLLAYRPMKRLAPPVYAVVTETLIRA